MLCRNIYPMVQRAMIRINDLGRFNIIGYTTHVIDYVGPPDQFLLCAASQCSMLCIATMTKRVDLTKESLFWPAGGAQKPGEGAGYPR